MSLFLDDGDVRLYHGDALQILQGLPAESVHCCVTSPPFYGLRDYGVTGQIGLEETPEAWVDSLVQVFREVRRVLRPEGTLWLEVGDSYAAAGGHTGQGETSQRQGRSNITEQNRGTTKIPRGYKPKDLIGAPWMLAFALRADGWYLRSDIVWARPNPMPESVTDRPTKSHSYVFLLAKQPRYFFDQEAVREPVSPLSDFGRPRPDTPMPSAVGHQKPSEGHRNLKLGNGSAGDPAGRNVRSVWNIATQPYPEAHFATFPEELAKRCILAGTSERGCCPECGAPWIRQVEQPERPFVHRGKRDGDGDRAVGGQYQKWIDENPAQTTGWRLACVHDGHAPCVVLDPFVGSGTVPHVARKHGRHAIGIDLSSSYLELAGRRLQQLSLFAQVQP